MPVIIDMATELVADHHAFGGCRAGQITAAAIGSAEDGVVVVRYALAAWLVRECFF